MTEEQFALLFTQIAKQNDILMMLLKTNDPAAADTVAHVHNDLNMYMHEDWEQVDAARDALKKF